MTRALSWMRIALIDLRGDVRRFLILVACLAIGVGAIATVSSVGAALQAAIGRDARVILGGDIEIRNMDADVNPAEASYFQTLGQVANVVDLNARARVGDASAFLNLRAVSPNYPLTGTVDLGPETGGATLSDLLADDNGIVVDARVLDRLGIAIGDSLELGNGDFVVRGTLKALPDQAAQGFQLGLPALVSINGLRNADLDQAGALLRFRYKILLDDPDFAVAKQKLIEAFPGAPWDIRSPRDATAELARFFDLFSRFLVLVGLSSLLVGGVGVSNAVSAYVNERRNAIATLRSLGATSQRIMVHFLVQVMLLSLVGILVGLVLGGAATLIALPILSDMLAIDLPPTLDAGALASAGGFGLLIGFAFGLLPLRRAQKLRPAGLFRAAGGDLGVNLAWRDILGPWTALPLLLAFGGIAGLAIVVTGEPWLVMWYAIGAAVAFGLLRLAAWVLQSVLRLLPPLPTAILRQAIKAIYRPGAPAPVVILSLGLGLALLLMITLLEANLRAELNGAIADKAPSFVLIDVQQDQLPTLTAFAQGDPQIEAFDSISMLRGTIETVNGRPASEFGPFPEEIADMFRGDTALSWARALPEGSVLSEGEWWPADYDGAPLVSLSTELKEPLGLAVGDTMTINVLGRQLDATIASFRDIDWRDTSLNFRLLFSPGVIERAPQDFMVTIRADKGGEAAVEDRLSQAFPALNLLPVGDALARVSEILGSVANSVAMVGSVAVLSGMLVLAGAMMVGRRQREADAVVMKVLGATRGAVILAFLVEYGLLGLLAAILAAVLGSLGAWAILTYVLELPFSLDVVTVTAVVLGAVLLTVATGLVTTWSAMSARPARRLRAEMT